MPIIQLVPQKECTDKLWWKKTIFQEQNGAEYILNSPVYFVLASVIEDTALRGVLELNFDECDKKFKKKMEKEVSITKKADQENEYNLEFKFGIPPYVVKLNWHLEKIKPGQYIPPNRKHIPVLSDMNALVGAASILLNSFKEDDRYKPLEDMKLDNLNTYGYKISTASKKFLDQQQILKDEKQEKGNPSMGT